MKSISYKIVITYIVTILLSLSLSAQVSNNSIIEFNKNVHNFGDIMLKSGKQTCTFTFKNISPKPVVIQTVISSCGCTTPEWTKSPVKPGATGKILVTFLNDQGPYPFDKALTVYVTGSPKPVILRIKGIVHQKKKNIKQLFPVIFGSIGLRKSPVDMGQIPHGTIERQTVEIANTSGNPVKVSFADMSKGLSLSANPSTIQPGEKAVLSVNIDTRSDSDWGLTSWSAFPVVNGRKVSTKLVFSATIREDFTNLTKEQVSTAPLPMASKSSFNFGTLSSGRKIDTTFEVKNVGKKDLLIHKIDVSENGINASNPFKIPPGSTGKISVSINTKGHIGEKIYILTLITNSPSRPLVNLLVTGELTK